MSEHLDPKRYQVLADALGDSPETVQSVHMLRRGVCNAYVSGDPARFEGVIVQSRELPGEPLGFGSNPEVLWKLLRSVQGWDCVVVDRGCASALGKMIEREMGKKVRYIDDVYYVMNQPAQPYHDEAVRLLNLDDLKMLDAAPDELRASLWSSPREIITEGFVACAVISGVIVAAGLTTACTDRYAEIGVFTLEEYRGRGYATAAASLVAWKVQEDGRTPVWSAGGHNNASMRVAGKLGCVEVNRRQYVILDDK